MERAYRPNFLGIHHECYNQPSGSRGSVEKYLQDLVYGPIGQRLPEDVYGDIHSFRAAGVSVSDISEALNDGVNPIGATRFEADRDDPPLTTLSHRASPMHRDRLDRLVQMCEVGLAWVAPERGRMHRCETRWKSEAREHLVCLRRLIGESANV